VPPMDAPCLSRHLNCAFFYRFLSIFVGASSSTKLRRNTESNRSRNNSD